jgi:hypothetical protein
VPELIEISTDLLDFDYELRSHCGSFLKRSYERSELRMLCVARNVRMIVSRLMQSIVQGVQVLIAMLVQPAIEGRMQVVNAC